MKRFLLTYDVDQVDRDKYPALYEELDRLGAVQALESVYLLESQLGARQVFEQLAMHVSEETKFLVVELASTDNWWTMRPPGAAWMKARGL